MQKVWTTLGNPDLGNQTRSDKYNESRSAIRGPNNKPGSNNSVADALSWPPEITSIYLRRYGTDSDYEEMSDSESDVSENQSSNTDEDMVRPKNWIEKTKLQKIEPDLI